MLSPSDLNLIQSAVAGVIQTMRPCPPGYVNEKAFDPSTGAGYVKAGNRDAFWYACDATNVASATGTSTQTINIAADADFYWIATSYQAFNHASLTALTESTNPIPNMTVLITDTGSSRQLMNEAVWIPTIAGDGKRPYRLLYPRLFQRTTSINFAFANLDSALALDIHFVLHGFKVYSNG